MLSHRVEMLLSTHLKSDLCSYPMGDSPELDFRGYLAPMYKSVDSWF